MQHVYVGNTWADAARRLLCYIACVPCCACKRVVPFAPFALEMFTSRTRLSLTGLLLGERTPGVLYLLKCCSTTLAVTYLESVYDDPFLRGVGVLQR
jgi:hypothetical protein